MRGVLKSGYGMARWSNVPRLWTHRAGTKSRVIRWPRRVAKVGAMLVMIFGAALVRPLAAQQIGEAAAQPASVQSSAQSADSTGPRVRQDMPRLEPRLDDHVAPTPMMKKKDEFVSVSTIVLVLLVAVVVILLVR